LRVLPNGDHDRTKEFTMRTRTPAALAIAAALALAACGSDTNSADDAASSPATTEVVTDDEMTDTTDAMSDDEMSDDEMSDDEMSDDEMSDDMSDEEMAAAEGDIVVIAAGRDDLTTLVAAVEAAGLAGTLAGDGPFTIGGANIVEADIFATNGVIHVIDTVLAP